MLLLLLRLLSSCILPLRLLLRQLPSLRKLLLIDGSVVSSEEKPIVSPPPLLEMGSGLAPSSPSPSMLLLWWWSSSLRDAPSGVVVVEDSELNELRDGGPMAVESELDSRGDPVASPTVGRGRRGAAPSRSFSSSSLLVRWWCGVFFFFFSPWLPLLLT